MQKNNEIKTVPVHLYPNAYVFKTKVLKDNKNKSGIYRWVNNINGKSYVGSSAYLYKRLCKYYSPVFLNEEVNRVNCIIYKALLKYSYDKFKLEILEYCEPSILLKREQYYIDLLQPEYNILKVAGSNLGFKHSVETKKLIGNTLKNRLRKLLPINVINIEDNTTMYFATNLEAAKYLKIGERTLSRYKSKNKIILKKYIVKNNIHLHNSYK